MIYCAQGHPLVAWLGARYAVATIHDVAPICRVCDCINATLDDCRDTTDERLDADADRVDAARQWERRPWAANEWSHGKLGSRIPTKTMGQLEKSGRLCMRFEAFEASGYESWKRSRNGVMDDRNRAFRLHPDTGEPRAEYLATLIARGLNDGHGSIARYHGGERWRFGDYARDESGDTPF